MKHSLFAGLALIMLVLLPACNDAALSTEQATLPPPATTAANETPVVTTVVGSPTAIEPTTQPPPTSTVAGSAATATATTKIEPTATPTAQPLALLIQTPEAESQFAPGSSLEVMGTAPQDAEIVILALRAAGILVAEAEVTTGNGSWQGTLTIPDNIVGPAEIEARLGDGSAVRQPVVLQRAAATAGPAVNLTHPSSDAMAVAGHVLFFTGQVQNPVNGELVVEVRYEECQAVGARQGIDVGEGGRWWAYVVIPETVFGPACALAYTGQLGEEPWQLAQTPVNILEHDDPEAQGLFIGNFNNSEVPAGAAVSVYGSAFSLPRGQVSVWMEVGGEIVAEGTAGTDRFGYWETILMLPNRIPAGSNGRYVVEADYAGQTERAEKSFFVVPGE